MNYTAWSELIYKYYFERHSDARVVLHITLQDLVDFAKEENVENLRTILSKGILFVNFGLI